MGAKGNVLQGNVYDVNVGFSYTEINSVQMIFLHIYEKDVVGAEKMPHKG